MSESSSRIPRFYRLSIAAPDLDAVRGDEAASSLAFQLDHITTAEPGPGDSTTGLRNSKRFTVDHRLGTGGMGVVYQAFDHERQDEHDADDSQVEQRRGDCENFQSEC